MSPNAAESQAPSHEPLIAALLCRVGATVCALPLEHVAETMRPQPVESIPGVPAFVTGVAIIRGVPLPVVDLARLLELDTDVAPSRFVTVRIAERQVAIAVHEVIGVRSLDPESVAHLPPLLASANARFLSTMGALDSRLLVLLETSKILPDFAWASATGAVA